MMALEWIADPGYLKFNLIYSSNFNFISMLFFVFVLLINLLYFVRYGLRRALEILPQVGVLIAICTNALRLFLESESPRSRRWYVSLATSCSDVLRTPIPGHIGRHVRTCETSFWNHQMLRTRDGQPRRVSHLRTTSQELRLQSPRISSERRGPSFTF